MDRSYNKHKPSMTRNYGYKLQYTYTLSGTLAITLGIMC